jgi:hypothetical protein
MCKPIASEVPGMTNAEKEKYDKNSPIERNKKNGFSKEKLKEENVDFSKLMQS